MATFRRMPSLSICNEKTSAVWSGRTDNITENVPESSVCSTVKMDRRDFFFLTAAAPLLGQTETHEIPKYKVVTPFKQAAVPGMPGPYKGQVVRVHSNRSVDESTGKVDGQVVRTMLAEGMRA